MQQSLKQSLSVAKQSLRHEMRDKLSTNSLSIDLYADRILDNLRPLLDSANNVLIYHASKYELDLSIVITYLQEQKKSVYHPLAYRDSKLMDIQLCDDSCESKVFYDKELLQDNLAKWYNLDLILLPMLACDIHGYRLGQGGGYYDTSLGYYAPNAIKCGVGFDLQLIDAVPHELHDHKLDYFGSELQLLEFI